jgi:aryl-alcohol dehydrogenase-like predicted oxidoreductase
MKQRIITDGRVSLTVSELCLGTMYFGYRTDEKTAFGILDRFSEAGGTFLDTANCYGQWHGDAGESERVIGRWLRSRGKEMVIASKVGARTTVPGDPDSRHWQGLSAPVIKEDAETSLRNLGVDRLDLYYAHIDDRDTPLEETVGALAELAESGKAGLLGASNTATWRIDRARQLAGTRPAYSCVQQEYSFLLPQPDPGQVSLMSEELKDYAVAEHLTLFGYSPLVSGAYSRRDRPIRRFYDHPTSAARIAVLDEAAAGLGVTVNQVVLAWMLSLTSPAVIPIPGASSVAQLEEILAATELTLDQTILDRLNSAIYRLGLPASRRRA